MRQCTTAILISLLISVTAAGGSDEVDFDTDVMPLLTRQGCNAGSCHGAALGRGGFHLSLLGSDAAADYNAITRALEGRRVNRVGPTRSLLLLKPSEQTGHEGGMRLAEDSASYEIIHRWIAQGAQRRNERQLQRLVVSPGEYDLERPGESVDFSVSAFFSPEDPTDVTHLTTVTADDPEAVTVDSDARTLTVHRRGVHIVIARFMDRVLPIRLTVPMRDHDARELNATSIDQVVLSPQDSKTNNVIDRYVNEQLVRLRLRPSDITDDHQFLRRATLDLSGRLPTPDEIMAFASDPSPEKRSSLIDRLLQSREFADYWALKWANILSIDAKQLQGEGAKAYHAWLADRLHQDASLSDSVRLMLTSTGDGYTDGPVNFLRFGMSPGDMAEQLSRTLMGVRLRCANCHNHPLDHWTQDDYHGLSAIFAKVKRGRIVSISERGEVTHPVTRQAANPRIPGARFLDDGEDGRSALATWLTAEDNAYMARATVNRVWRELMGRGLVEPVDDIRATNPATHPQLLEWLADDFMAGGFRIKRTVETICNSASYQRRSQATKDNAADHRFYSHAIVRPLEAEVIADAIGDVTGVALNVPNNGGVERMVRLTNNVAESRELDLLGRCDRSAPCTSRTAAPSLSRALHLINGPLLQQRLSDPNGTLAKLLRTSSDDRWVLDQLFLITLQRGDVSATATWSKELQDADLSSPQKRAEFFQDVLWSIMSSRAFITNH